MENMIFQKDCTFIRNTLMDAMVLGRHYDLDDLYKLIEWCDRKITDCHHKILAVLEYRMCSGSKYCFSYWGNAQYSLERI